MRRPVEDKAADYAFSSIRPTADLPVGASAILKNFRFTEVALDNFAKSEYIDSRLIPLRGAYRDRHGRGVGCGGRDNRA